MAKPDSAIQIAAFYHFQALPPERLEKLSTRLTQLGEEHGLKGLLILAKEGLNGTVSGRQREAISKYLEAAAELLGWPRFSPKWSEAPAWPFRKFKVRLRPEIVTLGKPEVQPLPPRSPTHLSPEEWDRMIEQEDVVVLDTRNWYETRIGKFSGAIDPGLDEFQEFSDYLKEAPLPKEKKILIYCTGGIRCEKAVVEMHNAGFESVFQLDGGILNYLARFPHGKFEGECFVFDNRVAVDQNLKPTRQYKMCPHCGQPAERKIECLRCDAEAMICVSCETNDHGRTCSKNCAHHHKNAPGKKGRSQNQGARYRL